jgi:transcriptional regulator with XRE-family HTH domain
MPDDIKQRVAAEVRAEAARRRVTQRDIAAVLGITQASVQKKMTGTFQFTVTDLLKLSQAWGVPLSQFTLEETSESNGSAA